MSPYQVVAVVAVVVVLMSFTANHPCPHRQHCLKLTQFEKNVVDCGVGEGGEEDGGVDGDQDANQSHDRRRLSGPWHSSNQHVVVSHERSERSLLLVQIQSSQQIFCLDDHFAMTSPVRRRWLEIDD